jgi:riboflavin kinase
MAERPKIIGEEAGPSEPYPYKMEGKVISGFGRGSKELGIPTANLPVDQGETAWITDIPSGVYFGYASLLLPSSHPDAAAAAESSESSSANSGFAVYPMVMSIGYNPFYKNEVRSAEVHVLHGFAADFYDAHMRLLILGFIRPERDYSSLDALIDDINLDCDVAKASLARPAWAPPKGLVVPGTACADVDGELDPSWLVRPL